MYVLSQEKQEKIQEKVCQEDTQEKRLPPGTSIRCASAFASHVHTFLAACGALRVHAQMLMNPAPIFMYQRVVAQHICHDWYW